MTASASRRTPLRAQKRSAPPAKAATKLDALVAALRRPKGASISELMATTGWQAHSVRGAIAGALKKGRGLSISSCKTGEQRIYKLDAKK